MDGDQTQAVWARIDAALARIERACEQPRGDGATGDAQLAERHLMLRGEVEQAMRQLDGLIAGKAS